MSENTKIQWADHTFNPWEGCTKISPGCAHCYADARARRFGQVKWGKGQPRRRTSAANWRQPVKWNREAEFADRETLGVTMGTERGPRPRVFCASLADWLDEEVPIEWLADLLQLIHDTPNLDWLLLTKRPENWGDRIAAAMGHLDSGTPRPTAEEEINILALVGKVSTKRFREITAPFKRSDLALWLGNWLEGKAPANVWIGVSVEEQPRADERIPSLLAIPAKTYFLSLEPLLGPVVLPEEFLLPDFATDDPRHSRKWAIIGGESGYGARPCNLDWIRSLVAQCRRHGVAPFVKQLGATVIFDDEGAPGGVSYAGKLQDAKGGDQAEWPEDLRVREFPVSL